MHSWCQLYAHFVYIRWAYQHEQEEYLKLVGDDSLGAEEGGKGRRGLLSLPLHNAEGGYEGLEPWSPLSQLLPHNFTLGEQGRHVGQVHLVHLKHISEHRRKDMRSHFVCNFQDGLM